MSLYEELIAYSKTDACPFHMPGHKRRLGSMADPFSFDITEIDGFDDLHHAEGILKEAQERAARLYGSRETHYLINGSTAGILAAVTACARAGGGHTPGALSTGGQQEKATCHPTLLMARNCHRSVWHAAYLNRLQTVYLQPEAWEELNGPVTPEEVERALKAECQVCAVVITSPTYDGVVSDVRAIADIAHRYGVPLIVDAAHGAHFGMHPLFPPGAVQQGADLVIHSLHKTLPSLTQTALLHVNGDLVSGRAVARMLDIYQSSSPSYVLMAGMDNCMRLLEEQGKTLFDGYAARLQAFWAAAGKPLCSAGRTGQEPERGQMPQSSPYRHLQVFHAQDPSRILVRPTGMTAGELYDRLRTQYRIQPEMCTPTYVLLLSSVADEEAGFRRLLRALREIDAAIGAKTENDCAQHDEIKSCSRLKPAPYTGHVQKNVSACIPPALLRLDEAMDSVFESIPIDQAEGAVSVEFLYLYPPGIPLIAPGERFTAAVLEKLKAWKRQGLAVRGAADAALRTVRTVSGHAATDPGDGKA